MGLYLLSDTHFGHTNIIEYCDRPFDSVREMNGYILSNWNEQVSYSDTVLFGGDLVYGRTDTHVEEVAEKTAGRLIVLEGNHDDINPTTVDFPVLRSYYFSYEYEGVEREFYYTHWPPTDRLDTDSKREPPKWATPPEWFDGWYIHGHIHNNDIDNYPFVNPREQYVNVGVELLEYTPIEIEQLIEILSLGERFEMIGDVPDSVYPF